MTYRTQFLIIAMLGLAGILATACSAPRNDATTTDRSTHGNDFIQCTEPAWSPDGTQIAFQATGGSEYISSIWVISVDGSREIRLASEPGCPGSAGDAAPAWSPDGAKIASESTHEGCGGERNWEIYSPRTRQVPCVWRSLWAQNALAMTVSTDLAKSMGICDFSETRV